MRIGKTLLYGTLCIAAPSAALAVPTTQPAPDVAILIHQLGDDNFQVRQSAFLRLRELGDKALPALRDARFSKETEIRERVGELLGELQIGPIPRDLPEPPRPGNGGFYSNWVRSQLRGGTRIIDANDNGRAVHIEEGAAGLHMMVRGQINGQPAIREYRVANLRELQEGNPEAYQLYRDCMRSAMNQMLNGAQNLQGLPLLPGQPFIVPPGALINPMILPPEPNPDLDRLQKQLVDEMNNAHVSGLQRNQVLDLLRQLRAVQTPAGANQDRLMAEYNRRSDLLRKQLQALKLPDPGDALPPPANERLGVSVNELADGLLVRHVLPGSRAQQLGLKESDIIEKVNGQPLHTVHEMRTALSKQGQDVTIEGQRDSKPFKLTIKPEKAGS